MVMQRSRAQILYRYLPGAVFLHEDGFVARTWRIDAARVEDRVNKKALLEAIEAAASQWPAERRHFPLPSTVSPSEFTVLEPIRADWNVWPLIFQCSNASCGRVKRFFNSHKVEEYADPDRGLVCKTCHSRLTQLPYFAAHACGNISELYTPTCKSCGSRDHVYFQDTGSFETSAWRCRNCGDLFIQNTRFVPCGCGDFPNRSGKSFMRLYTVRDRRSHYPHHVSIINLESSPYQTLRMHPHRGLASLATYIGDESDLGKALKQLDASTPSTNRRTPEDWAKREAQLREMEVSEEEIEALREKFGPATDGVEQTQAPEAVVALASTRQMLERAALLDKSGLQDRRTLRQAAAQAVGNQQVALTDAVHAIDSIGVAELSVSLQFPVLLGAYGYTRQNRSPDRSSLLSFADRNAYGGKTPIFAVTAETEALVVELSARHVYGWLHHPQGAELPATERDARLRMLELFAAGSPDADRARELVHSLSHSFLRALDDGQSGFGESSLAEWVVPEALTFAVYVSAYQEFTIGALWTLMHSRVRAWTERIEATAFRCDKDPLCHRRPPQACERCLFLTFGCPEFNDGLSRGVVMSFLRYMKGLS